MPSRDRRSPAPRRSATRPSAEASQGALGRRRGPPRPDPRVSARVGAPSSSSSRAAWSRSRSAMGSEKSECLAEAVGARGSRPCCRATTWQNSEPTCGAFGVRDAWDRSPGRRSPRRRASSMRASTETSRSAASSERQVEVVGREVRLRAAPRRDLPPSRGPAATVSCAMRSTASGARSLVDVSAERRPPSPPHQGLGCRACAPGPA